MLHRFDGILPVCLINKVRINKTALVFLAFPLPAHGLMIYNVQNMCLRIKGKKDVLGGLQGDLVTLLLLQKNIFRFLLPPGQIPHHIIQGIYLLNIGGLELRKSLPSPADALHETLNRSGQMSHQYVDSNHAKAKPDENGNHHPDIELAAHPEKLVFRVQAKEHPVRILVGHIVAVYLQGTDYRVNSLSVLNQ